MCQDSPFGHGPGPGGGGEVSQGQGLLEDLQPLSRPLLAVSGNTNINIVTERK